MFSHVLLTQQDARKTHKLTRLGRIKHSSGQIKALRDSVSYEVRAQLLIARKLELFQHLQAEDGPVWRQLKALSGGEMTIEPKSEFVIQSTTESYPYENCA